MSHSKRLADLETQAFANTAKIQELSTRNRVLALENTQQQELISRYESDLESNDSNNTIHDRPTISNFTPPPTSLTRRHLPPPNIPPTPFYIATLSAPSLDLSFVIPGFKGETLEYRAEAVDLAFILERTLERRGWGEEMVQKSVLDFLEVALMKVTWLGREGKIGMLS